MSALSEIFVYLTQTAAIIYTLLVLLRFFLQLARADFYNPASQFVVKATNAPLHILRRVVPGYFGVDLAAIVLAVLVQLIAISVIILLFNGPLAPTKVLTWALLNVVGLTAKFFYFSILAGIILSWVAPQSGHPLVQFVLQINEPVLAPFRRLLPAMGGMDFSPILVFVAINIINILLRHAAASSGMYSVISFGI